MKWYQEYHHDMNGLLVLDEKGFDRVAIGDPVPDPNIGKRIGPSTGMIINDEQGFERSGYGLLKVDDLYRVVLGLDSAKGQEGLTLALFDEGGVGLIQRDGDRKLYLGSALVALVRICGGVISNSHSYSDFVLLDNHDAFHCPSNH